VTLGFAVACVARTRTGKPGAPASTAAALILMTPSLVPSVARHVSTFPTSGGGGLSSNTVWWIVLAGPKTVKNRVHVDLASTSAAHQAQTVTRLMDLGAELTDIGQGDVPWTVMADPEAKGC
jgi:hypothetical protein